MNVSQLNILKNYGKKLTQQSKGATMNAVTLQILISYYYLEIYKGDSEWSKAELDGHIKLEDLKLLERNDNEYIITERGQCHVEALLNAPLPEQSWVSPVRLKL